MSKQSDRRAAGIDVLRTLSGGGFDPARAARGLIKRHGALGTFAVDHVLGTLWARPQLSRRDRSLIVLSFLCCLGGSAAEELGFHVKAALNHGLSREQIDEIVTHAAAYAGIPLAMACSRIVSEVWATLDGTDRAQEKSEARFQDDPERWQSANEVRTLMFGGRNAQDPAEDRAAIVDALGGVGEMAFDFAFGELWAREALSRRDRSMVTVSILAMTACTEELKIHLRFALNHGCTREELEEIMVQLTGYVGFPKAVEAHRVSAELFARLDKRAASK